MGRKEYLFLHHLAANWTKHLICGAMIGLGVSVNGRLLTRLKSPELFSQVSQTVTILVDLTGRHQVIHMRMVVQRAFPGL